MYVVIKRDGHSGGILRVIGPFASRDEALVFTNECRAQDKIDTYSVFSVMEPADALS